MFHVKQMESKAVDNHVPDPFNGVWKWDMHAPHDPDAQYHFSG
jgi:hypothetical protein